MTPSQEARDRLIIALTSRSKGNEVANILAGSLQAKQMPSISNVSVANATDLASAEALANANKAKINALLAALRTAGILAP